MNAEQFKRFAEEAQRLQTYTAPVTQPTQHERRRDRTREHALNWGLGTAIIAACVLVIAWIAARLLWSAPWELLPVAILAAILTGAAIGARKLITFTEEHRDYLYAVEELTQVDINNDGVIGKPKPRKSGALLLGIDGDFHRASVVLSPDEILGIKQMLLNTGRYTVRTANQLLGDDTRASALRGDLYKMGVLEQPRDRAATKLTEQGIQAVESWD